MRVLLLIIMGIFILTSCKYIATESFNNIKENLNQGDKQVNYKTAKRHIQFKFFIKNGIKESIGFKLVPDDQAMGIMGIALYKDNVYLTDAVNGNVKRINLLDGTCLSSNVLSNEPYHNLRSIAVFNEMLYVFTDKDIFFILDLDLAVKEQIKIEDWKWAKEIFAIKKDTLTVYRPVEDIYQLQDKRMQVCIVKILKNNSIERDTIICDYKDFWGKYRLGNNVRGITYSESNEYNKYFVETPFGKYQINEPLPTTSKYYDSKNLDFNNKYLVYFSITPTDFLLTVYEY